MTELITSLGLLVLSVVLVYLVGLGLGWVIHTLKKSTGTLILIGLLICVISHLLGWVGVITPTLLGCVGLVVLKGQGVHLLTSLLVGVSTGGVIGLVCIISKLIG
jgi:hypothetical protein